MKKHHQSWATGRVAKKKIPMKTTTPMDIQENLPYPIENQMDWFSLLVLIKRVCKNELSHIDIVCSLEKISF